MIAATLGPALAPQVAAEGQNSPPVGEIIGDIADFDASIHGKPYMTFDNETIYSATRLHKMAWADAGYPNLVMPFAHNSNGKSTSKACTPMTEGQSTTVPISGSTITVDVEKTTSTAAFLVESGASISSSVLNNLASTWSSSVYPTNTQYFGTEPDLDNNCQVQIVIYAIDGPANIGGYFSPGIANSREAIYVDIDDLTWANTILAHEFQHLLHNARDPFEYLWVDEGNADMAAYLNFGATSTIIGHANAWAQFPETSVRWWNQSDNGADYGAGFLFMLFLASKLGGGQAIQSLVSDTATGGDGIVNLANNPIPGSPGNIGSTMPDIFANFTVATLLDDSQNPFGLDNIDMYQNCGNSQFCKMQITDANSNWGSIWQRQGDELHGWGVRAYKFTGGTGSPLNVMVQA
ncbi:MAG TPA: hypothetical protein QF621_07545, partial [Candidatus Thalassarchaeaceae archaeon]|nr:hypothetical protein [Candidatus Thalassarchaeaceae archaeon]